MTYLAHEEAFLAWETLFRNFLKVVYDIAHQTIKIWNQSQWSIRTSMTLVLNGSDGNALSDETTEIVSFQKGYVVTKSMTKEKHTLGFLALGRKCGGAKGHSAVISNRKWMSDVVQYPQGKKGCMFVFQFSSNLPRVYPVFFIQVNIVWNG